MLKVQSEFVLSVGQSTSLDGAEWADGAESTSDSWPEELIGIVAMERETELCSAQAEAEPEEVSVLFRGYSIRPVHFSWRILGQSPEDSALRDPGNPTKSRASVVVPSWNVAKTMRCPQMSPSFGAFGREDP